MSSIKFIIDWLQRKVVESPKLVCFSGEHDTNQTLFEKQSNMMEVGVLATNEYEAKIMLRILRVIIDKNIDLLTTDESDDLASSEDVYFTSFPITTDKYTCELNDGTVIEKSYSDVDLWTRRRLYLALLPMSPDATRRDLVAKCYRRYEYRPLGQFLWEYCQHRNGPVTEQHVSAASLARYFRAHFSNDDPYKLPPYWNELVETFLTDMGVK